MIICEGEQSLVVSLLSVLYADIPENNLVFQKEGVL
jgi:hypothetical protein